MCFLYTILYVHCTVRKSKYNFALKFVSWLGCILFFLSIFLYEVFFYVYVTNEKLQAHLSVIHFETKIKSSAIVKFFV